MSTAGESEMSDSRGTLEACNAPPWNDLTAHLPDDFDLPRTARKALLRLLLEVHERQQANRAA